MTKVLDEAVELEKEQQAATGELVEDTRLSPEDEFDDPKDHAGEDERESDSLAEELGTELPAEKAEDAKEDEPVPDADQKVEEPEPEKVADETIPAGLTDAEIQQVVAATGAPEWMAAKLSPDEAKKAVFDAYMKPRTATPTAQPTGDKPQASPKAEPEPFDIEKYGLKKDDWDEASLTQLATFAQKLRDEFQTKMDGVQSEFSTAHQQMMQAQQAQNQAAAAQRFDSWVGDQANPELYGEGAFTALAADSPQRGNRAMVYTLAEQMYNGWSSQNPTATPPPDAHFFGLAENAVHSNFKRNNEQAAAAATQREAGVTARPTHRGSKPLTRDQQAAKDTARAGYDPPDIMRDPAELDTSDGEF